MKKVLSLLLICSMVIILGACGSGNGGKSSGDEWPTTGLGAMLPKPETGKIEINIDSDDYFTADISCKKEEEFNAYVDACKGAGFDVDSEQSKKGIPTYTAFNSDGYSLKISWYDSFEYYTIYFNAAVEMKDLTWPTIGLATLIPQPKSSKGNISIDSSSQFYATIGDTSIDDYNSYIEECINVGFNVDYDKGDKYYDADDAAGNSLRVEYEGFNQMTISMYAADEDDTTTVAASEETETTAVEETTTSGSVDASIDIAAGLDDIKNLASEGEEKLEEKLGDYFSAFSGLLSSDTYEDIYNEYSQSIIDKTPELIQEYADEAAMHAGDINSQAEICNQKVEVLAEIANEGVEKMASLYYKKLDYEEYNDWATKLYDVYMDYAGQIYDVYMNTAG